MTTPIDLPPLLPKPTPTFGGVGGNTYYGKTLRCAIDAAISSTKEAT